MARNVKYTKNQLYGATKSVKMIYLKRAKKGLEEAILSKSSAFKLIAKKLGLVSDRSLWVNSDYPYLEKWYEKFRSEVEEAYKSSQEKHITFSDNQELLTSDTKANYLEIIAALEKRVEILTIENLNLRTKLNK